MTYNIKTGKVNTKDMDYNNLGHEVQESNYWAACDKAKSKSS